ncbi:MAG: hypothetical protein IJ449_02825 [Clostridia bacterium]|nr:hypothetical protein [Clostridia bacterium]
MKQNPSCSLLLSAALACLLLAACADSGDGTGTVDSTKTEETSAVSVSAETEVLTPDLPEKDWEGKTFMVLGRDNDSYDQFDNFEIFSEGETGETVNDAVFRRNTAIEEKYNVVIEQTLKDFPHEELAKSINAGDHMYDLAFTELYYIGSCIQNGFFYNLNDVEYIDFSKPWWNADVNAEISFGGKLYATTSDFSLRDKNRAYILVYNMDLADSYDISDPVQTVRDGKWTVELTTQYAKLFAQDLDGDGQLGGEKDMFGLTMDSYNSFTTFIIGCDNLFITKDKDDNPVLSVSTEHTASSVDRVLGLTGDTSFSLFCNDFEGKTAGDMWAVASTAFIEERALFLTSFPHSLQTLSSRAEFDYGILPFPKFDEAQDTYYTLADHLSMLFGIPVTSPDASFSGFMLEALSAASTDTTLSAYYEIACKTKYSYNEASGEMLDLIFDGIRYDLSEIYGIDDINHIFTVTLPKKKENILASEYTKAEKKAAEALKKLSDALSALDH